MDSNREQGQFIIYDGGCGFCTNSAVWVRDHIDAPAVIVPNSPAVLAQLGVSSIDAARALQWVAPGERASGAAAVAAWFSTSSARRWRFAGWFIDARLIRPFAAAIYWLVARHRSRLSWMFRLHSDERSSP